VKNLKDVLAVIVGAVAIIAFGLFAYYLLQNVAAEPLQWERMVFVFGGVEAIAFSAVGYFFGREVHRERADRAESRVDEAQGRARAAEIDRSSANERLSGLHRLIETKVDSGRKDAPDPALAELLVYSQKSMQ